MEIHSITNKILSLMKFQQVSWIHDANK